MLRLFRPDLLCGLGGFALGAAALLLGHGATASPPPRAERTDILTQAQADPGARERDSRAG